MLRLVLVVVVLLGCGGARPVEGADCKRELEAATGTPCTSCSAFRCDSGPPALVYECFGGNPVWRHVQNCNRGCSADGTACAP
jgi:hypothetical protein